MIWTSMGSKSDMVNEEATEIRVTKLSVGLEN